jgi:DNA polymerase I-like protein with 3'-5' exonuclease and polymerase domains
MKPMKTGPHEIDPENVQPITKDLLKDSDKAELEAYMKHYEELCLASYGQIKSGVFKKNPLPTPKQVTFSADLEGLQDMMTKAMHQTMIDQSKVFANTIQNAIIDALKKVAEGGYLRPAYY